MNSIQNKLLVLILANFALGMLFSTDLFLPESKIPLVGLVIIYGLSILLFISVGMLDYRVYKYGLEKGILLKGENNE